MVEGGAGFHKSAEEAHTRRSGLNDGKSERQHRPHQSPIQCPECTSQRVWKDGVRSTRYGNVQRYVCRSCGYRFSESKVKFNVTSKLAEVSNPRPNLLDRGIITVELSLQKLGYDPSLPWGEDVGSHKVTTVGENLNSLGSYNRNRRVRVSEVEAKNLAEVEPRSEKRAAGATEKPTEGDVKGKLVEYAWWMKKQGYAESTIKGRVKILKILSRKGANIFGPESMKEFIAKQPWKESSKKYAVIAYSCFLQMLGLSWQPPIYRRRETMPFIPLEEEIDQLIACCGRVMVTFLQGLKETGADPGELIAIRWIDVDRKNKAIAINRPVKGHNPRVVHVSSKLIDMLEKLPKRGERVFITNVENMYKNFRLQRRKAARKLANPRLEKITFITLRHLKGTMEYHKTKDILHVKRVLGHKCIQSTMVYINLDQAYFSKSSEEFTVRIAHDVNEACELVEAGFEYVTGEYSDGGKVFRKRK